LVFYFYYISYRVSGNVTLIVGSILSEAVCSTSSSFIFHIHMVVEVVVVVGMVVVVEDKLEVVVVGKVGVALELERPS
jgi:hypothetical protein